MKPTLLRILFPFFCVIVATAADELAPMPAPLTNNAVALVKVDKQNLLYSFMGLGAQKTWNSVTNAAYALNLKYDKWTNIKPVPGSGRLGASAVGVKEHVFVIGGYVPHPSGRQSIVPDVSIYVPLSLVWYRGADLPSPVRDAVAGEYRDRYIYVVGGFGKNGPTSQVQIYDTETDHWMDGTPTPGSAVFGHAGAVVDDSIIYVDGAKQNPAAEGARYIASDECWIGKIDHHDPRKILWSKLPGHPGAARYRIAAGASDRDDRIYFAGGSETVYDYTGVGLDGKPAEPSSVVFAYNLKSSAWETVTQNGPASMDHHALAVTGDGLIIAGGMAKGQQVIANVTVLSKGK